MAYDEHTAERLEQSLKRRGVPFLEKKMFGGLCFMVDDKMCLGVVKNEVMVRVHPDQKDHYMSRPGTREMDFTGKRMKGFYFIAPEGIDSEENLDFWVDACLEYNPLAKRSKSKK